MTECRFCKTKLKENLIDLGTMPLANAFLEKKNLQKKERVFPLKVFVCHNCLLVQLEEFESAKNIFEEYIYFSSFSKSFLHHAKSFVEMMIKRFNINTENTITEIASNDGYLLQYFKERKIPTLGIEPAKNIAKIAEKKGIPTISTFFNSKTALELKKNGKSSDIIICNNVLAHVPKLNDFVNGLKILLKKNGIITCEFPHLLELINNNQFDTIYHEHFSYFSFFIIKKIFESGGLEIFDVEQISTHGGSLRIFCKHENNSQYEISQSVKKMLDLEKKTGIMELSYYKDFSKKIEKTKNELKKFCKNNSEKGLKIVGYGAPAKANTLLNYCKISSNEIEYVVDLNPHKQELHLPGTHIQIKNPLMIKKTKPDYLLIFPWNLKEEIIEQNKFIRDWGGKFVIPIPNLKILE